MGKNFIFRETNIVLKIYVIRTLLETFKIMEFQIMVDIFSIFILKLEIYCHQISKFKSPNQLDIFAKRRIYFWNKLPNKIKTSNGSENSKIKLNDFRKNGKKKK